MILAGRVMVNGATVTAMGTRVQPGDVVWLDGSPVWPEQLEYHLLNKPTEVIATVSDPGGHTTVVDLVASAARLFPVGRLDQNTTGLIILTNDGPLAHSLMHPSFQVDKVYKAEVEGEVTEPELDRLRRGIELEDGKTSPAQALLMGRRPGGSYVEVVLHEGHKRQVRRMFEAIGHPVWKLHRKRYAMLTDAGLASGESRPLKQKEVEALRKLAKGEPS